ncbi:MAG TPA: aldo/keto reductase [Beijerinckiaceae bacterium]|jgi:aryl-alcohol dehydrogenase-like predicted oxidoreductase
MQTRRLGRSDIHVPPFCLGGNVFGWTADETASFAVLDAYLDAGFTFIDTADIYSTWGPGHTGGESETVIGRWMKARGCRDRVVIATKVGGEMAPDKKGLSKAYILQAVEDSLRRLQTDVIDLYQSHFDDENLPVEEPLQAYDALIKAGKVRAVGASNFSPARLSAALDASRRDGLPRYESLQPGYNLYDRQEFEAELADLCRREELGVIPYFSLAAGFLTGKYRSKADLEGRARAGRVGRYLDARGERILSTLDAVAADQGATPAQVALAWLIARPGLTAPIASATSVAQLDELLAAPRLSLSADTLARLDEASA